MSSEEKPGDRLERALEAFLTRRPTTRRDEDALLQRHPDLADLLEPMLARGPLADGTVTAGPATTGPDGQRVLGDYRLVREIGRGGMGIVYEAWQRSLDRRVAVKVLAGGDVGNASAIARFRREAAAAARLQHPNIVEVFGFGSDAGEHFFAMQFVAGRPLHDVAERFREPARAVRLGVLLADALACAHGHGLVHRDVKPGNVLVRDDDTPLLTDFGVARDASLPTLTQDGSFLGTLAYASPEQVRGEIVDATTDVWSLGVVLHELLRGEHPFEANTREATLHRILRQEPPSLRGLPGIGDDLAAVIGKALRPARADRYASAAALRDDLRAVERGDAVTARLPGAVERLRRWATREPWRAVAAAVLLLGVPTLTGAVGYLWANAPRIAAATAAEQALAHEERLASAMVYLTDGDPRSALDSLPAAADGGDERAILRTFLHMRLGDIAAARAELAGRSGPVVDLMRRFAERPQDQVPDDAPTGEAFDCFVYAYVLGEASYRRGHRVRPLLQRAAEFGRRAILLSPAPRLNYLAVLTVTGELLDDRAIVQEGTTALARHFPDSRVARFVRARSLVRINPAESLRLLDGLDAEAGATAQTTLVRGLACEQLGRLDEAVQANRSATALDPRNEVGWHNLAACLRKQKDLAGAETAMRAGLAQKELYAPGWNQLGLILRERGKLDDAAAAFTKALELAPDYGAAALNLGNLRMRSRDFVGAVAAFRRAVEAEPTSVRAAANLGDALGRLGQREDALRWSLRATWLAPQDLIPHYNAARLALDLKLPQLAMPLAARAREVAGKDPNALQVYAEALLAQQPLDTAAALAAARAADSATTGADTDGRVLLARALRANGDRDGAVAALESARSEARFAGAAAQQKLAEALAAVRAQ